MSWRRLLTASALVSLLAAVVAVLATSGGRGGLTSLLWVVGLPVVAARAFDSRQHAWVATAVWLVMCSIAAVAGIGELAKP